MTITYVLTGLFVLWALSILIIFCSMGFMFYKDGKSFKEMSKEFDDFKKEIHYRRSNKGGKR